MGNDYYELHHVTDPAKPFIWHTGQHGCMAHWHENIEILRFHGAGHILCDREPTEAAADDLAVFGTNSLHAVSGCEEGYDCLIVDGRFLEACSLSLPALRFRTLVRDPEALELFDRAALEITDADGGPFGAAARKAAILALCVDLCRRFSEPRERSDAPDADGRASEAGRRALGYVSSHLSEPMTGGGLADYVKVSKYYFCREFRRSTGYTVVRYVNHLRCGEAERLLRTGSCTVSEAARACGFENLSYFTRTFRAITGKKPSEAAALPPTDGNARF